ncbi:MAG: SGNH/GDSL hydrolase family protein [Actinoplanes sp.]
MRGRRLLAGVTTAAALSAVLTLAWVVPGPLPTHGPGPETSAVAAPPRPEWSTAWAAGPVADTAGRKTGYPGMTFRNIVHTTIGGPRVRIRLTNRLGTAPVTFGHVTVALSAYGGGRRDGTLARSDGTAALGTLREVRFGGLGAITVPVGADAVSDPVTLDVPADTDLLISIWTPEASGLGTYHPTAKQISYLSPGPADRAGDPTAAGFRPTGHWYYLSGVEVTAAPGTVVALGDSITDGGSSGIGLNRRWPDYLAARLADSPLPDYGVANAGISGNRLLLDSRRKSVAGRSAQARFGADVLERPGARSVVILLGINDIMITPQQTDPGQIIAGLAQLCARARAQDLRVVVGTLTPFRGWHLYSPQREGVRQAVNAWIRSGGGGAFDAVADFDLALRDPADPGRLRAEFDGGDHLHPNDAGELAIANVVPLEQL